MSWPPKVLLLQSTDSIFSPSIISPSPKSYSYGLFFSAVLVSKTCAEPANRTLSCCVSFFDTFADKLLWGVNYPSFFLTQCPGAETFFFSVAKWMCRQPCVVVRTRLPVLLFPSLRMHTLRIHLGHTRTAVCCISLGSCRDFCSSCTTLFFRRKEHIIATYECLRTSVGCHSDYSRMYHACSVRLVYFTK